MVAAIGNAIVTDTLTCKLSLAPICAKWKPIGGNMDRHNIETANVAMAKVSDADERQT